MNRVPVSRRQARAEPRRLAAGALAVGTCMMLVLLLDGLWTGITRSVTAYEDHVGANVYVAEQGTRNFFGAVSQIPERTADEVRSLDGVDWAVPVRTFLAILSLHGRKVPISVVGWDVGEPGGPWTIDRGRAPRADGEVVVGDGMAERHGIRIGALLEIMGSTFRVVGTSSDTFMLSFAFMTRASSDVLLKSSGTTSFVIARTFDPAAVHRFAEGRGLAALDRSDLASNDIAVMTRAYSVPLAVMRLVAFAIGVLVVTLTVYAALIDHRREFGVIKAMGGGTWMTWRIALGHTAILAGTGVLLSVPLFLIARAVIASARPQFWVVVTPGAVVRTLAMAAAVALLASALPARRLATLQPALAYGGE